jgi:hypothetical protein
MKKVFTSLFLLYTIFSFAQEKKLVGVLPLKGGKVFYTGEVQVFNVDKANLLLRAKKWFADTVVTLADGVVVEIVKNYQLDDKETDGVTAWGYFKTGWQVVPLGFRIKVNVLHKVKVYAEDNIFKYEITDLRMIYYSAPSGGPIVTSGGVIDQPIELISTGYSKQNQKSAKKYYTQVDEKINLIIASLSHSMENL